MDMMSEFIKVSEIAQRLRLSRMSIYRLLHGGQIPYYSVGRSYRILRVDFDAYLERSKRS